MGFTDRKKGRRVTNMELYKTNQERENMENCCKEERPYWRIGETEACFVEVGDVITVEESWPFSSVGSEIVNLIQREAFDYLDSPVIKVNSADVPMPYSSVLEKIYLPQVENIIKAVKEVCYE